MRAIPGTRVTTSLDRQVTAAPAATPARSNGTRGAELTPSVDSPTAEADRTSSAHEFSVERTCPGCGCSDSRSWGTYRDRPRFRCPECRRTWTALTGTAAGGVRKREVWLDHLAVMTRGGSMRSVAAELGVTRRTVSRWRRKLTRLMNERRQLRVGGRVQVAAVRPFFNRWMHLLVLTDDVGHAGVLLLPRDPRRAEVASVLRTHVDPGSVLVLRSRHETIYSLGAEAAGLDVERGGDIDRAWAYASRVKAWLRRFRGTRHHEDYLAWFDAVQSLLSDAERFASFWAAEASLRPNTPQHVPATRPALPSNTEGRQC